MESASLLATHAVQTNTAVQTASRRKKEDERAAATRDTVDISQEARELLAQMLARANGSVQTNPAQSTEQESKTSDLFGRAPGQDTASQQAAAKSAGGTGSVSGSGDTGDQVDEINQKIQKLTAQLKTIMSSPATPEAKQTQAMPVQQQIAELQQQLAKLKTDMTKG